VVKRICTNENDFFLLFFPHSSLHSLLCIFLVFIHFHFHFYVPFSLPSPPSKCNMWIVKIVDFAKKNISYKILSHSPTFYSSSSHTSSFFRIVNCTSTTIISNSYQIVLHFPFSRCKNFSKRFFFFCVVEFFFFLFIVIPSVKLNKLN
jgi:hypothetical protein